jgi:hypothetical protein
MGVQLSHSGSTAITVGVFTQTITGLGLAFTPTSVTASVRKPASDSPNIGVTPYGAPTAGGFSVEFSAAAEVTGYYLDWIVWADSVAIDTTGTLLLAYADICAEVSRFLGYPVLASQTAAQTAEVDSYVQSGVRQFYYPPAMQGVEAGYEWSFLKPTTTLATVLGVGTAALPASFGRLAGDMHYASTVYERAIVQVSEARIQALLQQSVETGKPRYVAIRYKQAYGAHGQTQEAVFWPIPDAIYTLTYRYEGYNGKLSALNPCPLGGMRHTELILESCLAIAEQRANDEKGLHSERFLMLLAAGVAQDRRAGGRYFGEMGGGPDEVPERRDRQTTYDVTYKGVTW